MRVTGVIIRIIRQFFRDKRSLAMMFGAPMLLLWLLSLVFTQKDYVPHIAVVDMPAQLVKVMKNQEASIYEYNTEKAMSELENQKVDAVIRLENGKAIRQKIVLYFKYYKKVQRRTIYRL